MGEYTYLIILVIYALGVYASGVLIEHLAIRKRRAHDQPLTTDGAPAPKPAAPGS